MYFWNYRQLSRDLKDNAVSDRQYRIYLVIFWPLLLWHIWQDIEDMLSSSLSTMTLHHIAVLLFYPIWLGITYRLNSLGDGKDYFKRLVCIKLPTTIIVFTFGMIVIFLKYEIVAQSLADWTFLKELQITADKNNIYNFQWFTCMTTIVLYMDAFHIASGGGDTRLIRKGKE